MKYNVMGFSQEKLIEKGLDLKDAALLRYLIDFIGTDKMRKEIVEGEVYYWIKYDGVVKKYPILGFNNVDSVYRRLKKFVRLKILKHLTIRANGTYSYYAFGEDYLDLISSTSHAKATGKEYSHKVKKNVSNNLIENKFEMDVDLNNDSIEEERKDNKITVEKNIEGTSIINSDEKFSMDGLKFLGGKDNNPAAIEWKYGPNNYSINNYSIKNNIYKKKDKEDKVKDNIIKQIVDYLNLKGNMNYKHTSAITIKNIKARLNEGFILNDFYKVIDNKFLEWYETDMERFLRPETLFGNKFEGYLNQKPITKRDNEKSFVAENESRPNAGMYKLLD
ncbi:conserved phage C-terminal domain-containing protein [Clostridium fungisolvens]|uniref:Phage conserved hypothetical protein C-terminal domain-containing protein n=1 Tax=Clostridium fungisolvens TaxID=1604897 RepID=A0A6V8SBT4_9CLOT|nr:conserved phage C-terminal domain-containing protein [Clostridium fungisolvens]GFP74677.1 hypothetical protein bsdtw1_00732 [Clostridium fungisolvens]